PDNNPAKDLRAMLDDVGLVCCGTHIGLDTLLGDALKATVEFNQVLGNKFLIVPWIDGPKRADKAACVETGKVFDGVADALKPFGMQTGYHNHHAEFTPVDGETPWDSLFSATQKSVVMQLDTGNGLAGNADLVGILRKFPSRATTLHLKPYSTTAAKTGGSEAGYRPLIGEDDVPWSQVFELVEAAGGTEWYIVEYESDAYPSLEAVERCLKVLRDWGK
ncbi:MAG: sugar phosphate isomerase/epimerase, partial [Armatimonadetes bacterium]|nr:sugar phosphate isomerase/epimerase [Armatimonadota bacterium]